MNDFARFEQLISNGCCCISIVTYEEKYALEIARQAARNLKRNMWIWSASEGVRDGLAMLDETPPIADTDNAEKGLTNLAGSKPGTICVTLDIAEQLRTGKAMRILRENIEQFQKTSQVLVLIDSTDKLPDVVKSYARTFELSFPDEKELEEIIRATVLRIHRKKPIEVGLTVHRPGRDCPQPSRPYSPTGGTNYQRYCNRRI